MVNKRGGTYFKLGVLNETSTFDSLIINIPYSKLTSGICKSPLILLPANAVSPITLRFGRLPKFIPLLKLLLPNFDLLADKSNKNEESN